MGLLRKDQSVLAGFKSTLTFTLIYLLILVVLPLSMLYVKSFQLGWERFWVTVTAPRVLAALQLSFGASLISGTLATFLGLIVGWSLVRYRFPGRSILDMLVDLPFALPTAVAGIALTTIYSPSGILGQYLAPWGIQGAFSRLGIIIAMTFIGMPFVIRALQPVLEDLEKEIEEASACLGATRFQTFFYVLFPTLMPALLSGFVLAFARALGEYGSVVFISGNLPFKTEIAPLLIIAKLEQYDYNGATSIATVILTVSFVILLLINVLHWYALHRKGEES